LQAAEQVAQVEASLASVENLYATDSVGDLQELKRISRARANLATVLEQLDLYTKVLLSSRGGKRACRTIARTSTPQSHF